MLLRYTGGGGGGTGGGERYAKSKYYWKEEEKGRARFVGGGRKDTHYQSHGHLAKRSHLCRPARRERERESNLVHGVTREKC